MKESFVEKNAPLLLNLFTIVSLLKKHVQVEISK